MGDIKELDKAKMANLMSYFMNTNYNKWEDRDIRLRKIHASIRLKELEVPIADKFIAHQVLNQLLSSFDQLKSPTIPQKDK